MITFSYWKQTIDEILSLSWNTREKFYWKTFFTCKTADNWAWRWGENFTLLLCDVLYFYQNEWRTKKGVMKKKTFQLYYTSFVAVVFTTLRSLFLRALIVCRQISFTLSPHSTSFNQFVSSLNFYKLKKKFSLLSNRTGRMKPHD